MQLPLWKERTPAEQWATHELGRHLSWGLEFLDVRLIATLEDRWLAVFEVECYARDFRCVSYSFSELSWTIEADASLHYNGWIHLKKDCHTILRCSFPKHSTVMSCDTHYLEIWGALGYPDYGAELIVVPDPSEFPLPCPPKIGNDFIDGKIRDWYNWQNVQYFANKDGHEDPIGLPQIDKFNGYGTPQIYVMGLVHDLAPWQRWEFEYAKWSLENNWNIDQQFADDLYAIADLCQQLYRQADEFEQDSQDQFTCRREATKTRHDGVLKATNDFWRRKH